jgi:rhodanese-related sulfurtransferase
MNIKIIDCDTLQSWQAKNKIVLVDVREPYENEEVRIKGAILIPLGGIDEDKLPILGDKKLVMQCRVGARSTGACQKLLAQNPDLDIYNLEGGINAWIKCGFETLTNK